MLIIILFLIFLNPITVFASSSDGFDSSYYDSIIFDLQSQLDAQIELYASSSSSVNEAYISNTMVNYFKDTLQDELFPFYVAYRPSSDSSEANLIFSSSRPSVSSSLIVFSDCYLCHFYREYLNNTWHSRYVVTYYDSYMVSYNSTNLLYTNLIRGYPRLVSYDTDILLFFISLTLIVSVFFKSRRSV